MQKIRNNLWKFFFYELSHRRNFIPILSIFFLTLPGTVTKQIGIYSGIGYLMSFLFEIPSGYISDVFGHKKTLIISKVLAILSVISYILADSLPYFIIGSIFQAIAQAMHSGTNIAFFHNTLIELKRESEFTKLRGKLQANVSIVSMFLIILLPLATSIDIRLPFKIALLIDIMGLVAAISLVNPQRVIGSEEERKSIWKVVKGAKPRFFPLAIFTGAVMGFMMADAPYRMVYLESLGYPVIFAGFVMGLSRLVWFFVGHNIHRLEGKITEKQHYFINIFIYTGLFLIMGFVKNPYILSLALILVIGYRWGESALTGKYLLNQIGDKKYKATMLSISGQIIAIFKFSIVFGVAFIMDYSYSLGYLSMGILLFIVLVSSYWFIRK